MLFILSQLFYKINPPKIDSEITALLSEHSSFFMSLNDRQKRKFLKRILLYMRFVWFSGSPNLYLTKKMKVIIAGAAIQITFGLKRFLPKYYRTFHLMRGQYKIPELTAFLLGHVDKTKKTITLSWPDAEHGFLIPDDAHNVVLHEMAHVILFENSLRFSWEEFFSRRDWDNWLSIASIRFLQLQNQKSPVLRDYAKNNLLELFAVSIETFFEQPGRLKLHMPKLYLALSNLLRQDPVDHKFPM